MQIPSTDKWVLVLFHLALKFIFRAVPHRWADEKSTSKKYSINSGAFLFWSLIEVDLFCDSAALSILLKSSLPHYECYLHNTLVSGKVGPNMRRLSTAGEIQPLNKKVVKLVWKAYNSHASLKQKEH